METLNIRTVQSEIMNLVKEVKEKFHLGNTISEDVCPGSIGIASQVLIDVMVRIGSKLGVSIPDNIYIFYDKESRRQLSIKEASKKLIKVVTNGK